MGIVPIVKTCITQNYNNKLNANFGVLKHFATERYNDTVSVVSQTQKQIKDHNNLGTKRLPDCF